jgi:hypothetical protein
MIEQSGAVTTHTTEAEMEKMTISGQKARGLLTRFNGAMTHMRESMEQMLDLLEQIHQTRAYQQDGFKTFAEFVAAKWTEDHPNFTKAQRQALSVRFRKMGLSLAEIAGKVDASRATVLNDLKASGEDLSAVPIEDKHGRVHEATRAALPPAPPLTNDLTESDLDRLRHEMDEIKLTLNVGTQFITVEDATGVELRHESKGSGIQKWWAEHRYDFAEALVRQRKALPSWYVSWVEDKMRAIDAARTELSTAKKAPPKSKAERAPRKNRFLDDPENAERMIRIATSAGTTAAK